MKKQKYLKYVFLLLIVAFVSYLSLSFVDPDFGWHLTTGNLILKSGFPKTDPFSYTMPSFPFIEHEWLVDIFFAKLYPFIGLVGISLIFSTLFLSSVLLSVSKSKVLKNVFIIIGISSLAQFFSVSPKIFSWLLFSTFTFLVFDQNFWKKYWFLIPLITVLWTNLHGSFPEALVILLVIVVCKSFREKHIWGKGVLTTLLCFLATLINPYGLKLWQMVWLTISDSSIKFRIAEWQPAYTNMFDFPFLALLLLVISAVLISKYRRMFKAEQIIINLILFVQAMFAIRNIPFWVLFDLSMAVTAINYYYGDVKKIKFGQKRFSVFSKVIFIFVGFILTVQCFCFVYTRSNIYKEKLFYPEGATLYLKGNIPKDQIFSEYDWGGYLVWKLPEKKVFIDGMMPVWRWKAGIKSESDDAMDDYINIIEGKTSYKDIFDKYNIDTVVLAVTKQKSPVVKFATDKVKYSLSEQLQKDGWQTVYQDSSSIILRNNDTNKY